MLPQVLALGLHFADELPKHKSPVARFLGLLYRSLGRRAGEVRPVPRPLVFGDLTEQVTE